VAGKGFGGPWRRLPRGAPLSVRVASAGAALAAETALPCVHCVPATRSVRSRKCRRSGCLVLTGHGGQAKSAVPMPSYDTSDIRKGLKVMMDGAPYAVVEFQFIKPGKARLSRAPSSRTCSRVRSSNAIFVRARSWNRPTSRPSRCSTFTRRAIRSCSWTRVLRPGADPI